MLDQWQLTTTAHCDGNLLTKHKKSQRIIILHNIGAVCRLDAKRGCENGAVASVKEAYNRRRVSMAETDYFISRREIYQRR